MTDCTNCGLPLTPTQGLHVVISERSMKPILTVTVCNERCLMRWVRAMTTSPDALTPRR